MSNERIVSAAIYYGVIISLPAPARHHHIITSVDKNASIDGPTVAPYLQGFLTSHGRYVNRIEGYSIAWAAKQIISGSTGPELFSEDLW